MKFLKKLLTKPFMIGVIGVVGAALVTGAIIFKINYDEVKIIKKEITIEAGEKLDVKIEDLVKTDKDILKELSLDTSKLNTKKVGEYKIFVVRGYNKYKIDVEVVDTTGPQAEFSSRVIFTNDLEKEVTVLESVTEYSDYDVTFIALEKESDLKEMTDADITTLEESIVVPCDQKALKEKKSDMPKDEGIYRSVMLLADIHGNKSYEEVYVVYDKTAPRIEDIGDLTIETKDVSKEPKIDEAIFKASDNVDGANVEVEQMLSLSDGKKHIYISHVTAKDRAGNEAEAEFQITLVLNEEATEDIISNQSGIIVTPSSSGSTSSGEDTSGNSTPDSGNGGGTGGNTDGDTGNNDTGGNSGGGSQSSSSEFVEDEPLTEGQQAAVNAGYYQVVTDSDGDYFVIVKDSSESDYGFQLIEDRLNSMGYKCASWRGYWKDNGSGQLVYVCAVTEIAEIGPSIEDDDFWRE